MNHQSPSDPLHHCIQESANYSVNVKFKIKSASEKPSLNNCTKTLSTEVGLSRMFNFSSGQHIELAMNCMFNSSNLFCYYASIPRNSLHEIREPVNRSTALPASSLPVLALSSQFHEGLHSFLPCIVCCITGLICWHLIWL